WCSDKAASWPQGHAFESRLEQIWFQIGSKRDSNPRPCGHEAAVLSLHHRGLLKRLFKASTSALKKIKNRKILQLYDLIAQKIYTQSSDYYIRFFHIFS